MSKALNTIRARCWAMTRAFSNLAEVEGWLVGIEGGRS
jgi:hypothetical protein